MVRINKNTPAVTRVDECTRAEIGVGAAMAIGSQAENGYWALFDEAASIIMIIMINGNSLFNEKFQFLIENNILIENKIIISPIRLLNRVIDPDAAVIKF